MRIDFLGLEAFLSIAERGSFQRAAAHLNLSQTAISHRMRKLEEELGRRRLDEIADVVRALTYGEMMELAASMWNVRPDGGNLTEHNLPAVLYRWSTSRQS